MVDSAPDTAPARPFYLRAPDAKLPKDLLQKAGLNVLDTVTHGSSEMSFIEEVDDGA